MLDMMSHIFLYQNIDQKSFQRIFKAKYFKEKLNYVISLVVQISQESRELHGLFKQLYYFLQLDLNGIKKCTKKYIDQKNLIMFKVIQQSGIRQYSKYYNRQTQTIKKLSQQQKDYPKKDQRKNKSEKNQNIDTEQQKNEAPVPQIPKKIPPPKQNQQAPKNEVDLTRCSPSNLLNQNQRDKLRNFGALPPKPKQQSPLGRNEDDHHKSSLHNSNRLDTNLDKRRSFSQEDLKNIQTPCGKDSLHNHKPVPQIDPQSIIETQQPKDDNLIQKKSDKFKTQRTTYSENNDIFIGKISEKYKSREGLGLWKSKKPESSSKFILGQWKNDEVHGIGYTEFKTGKIQFFMGEYKDSQPSQGYMRDQNGAQFYGSFYNGQPNGKGMFIFPNKDYTYKGGFREGKFHGRGELLDMVKQRTIIGVWNQGVVQHIQDSKFFLGYDLRDSVAQKQKQQEKNAQAQRKQKERQELLNHKPTKQYFNQDLKMYEILKKQNPKMYEQILRDRNIDPQFANISLMKSWAPNKTSSNEQTQAKDRKKQMINGQLRFVD